MSLGSEPAFPTSRAGHSPEPGLSIRDYVEIEILAKLYVQEIREEGGFQNAAWCVEKAAEAAEAWLLHREKRNGVPNRI